MVSHSAASISAWGAGQFLDALRDSLKDCSFFPLPSRVRLILMPAWRIDLDLLHA